MLKVKIEGEDQFISRPNWVPTFAHRSLLPVRTVNVFLKDTKPEAYFQTR
jgi:hypothetical protein